MRRSCFSRSRENLNDVLSLLSHLNVDAMAKTAGWRLRRRKLPLSRQLSLWVRAMWRGGNASLATMIARHNLVAPEAMRVTEQALSKLDCRRPWELFAQLFEQLAARADRGLRRHLGNRRIVLLDGSMVKGLAPRLAAFFPLTSNAGRQLARLKLHMLLDLDVGPRAVKITDGNNSDGQHTDFIWKHVRCNRLFVFDLGYWNFAFLDSITDRGGCFVTRVFPTSRPVVVRWIRRDDCWRDYVARLDRYPDHPKKHAVRVIEQRRPDGTWWRWCTNVMDADALPAECVPKMYRLRWQIEIFFRQMKQMLGLKRVHSMNVNAVLVELFCALIAYLVMHWLVRWTAMAFPLPPNRRYCLRRACRLVGVLSERLKLPLSALSKLIEPVAIHCTTAVNKKRATPTQNAILA